MPSRLTSLRSVSLLTGASIVTLAVQFGYQLLLARFFGASAAMDAYGAALTPPTILSTLLMGSLGYAFLPRFIDSSEHHGAAAGWQLAASLGWLLTIGLAALCAAAAWLARPLMAALYPGFSDADVALTAGLFRWLVWLALLNSLIGFLQALHHARRSFVVPAAATIIGTLLTLVWTWLRAESNGISAVVEGVVWGAAVGVAIQAPLFLRHCPWRIVLDEPLRRTVALTVPLLLGGAYFKLEPQLDRYLASTMPEGTIAQLGYSKALVQALLLLTTSSLSIVLFPVISQLATQRRFRRLRLELEHSLQFLALLLIPLGAAVVVFGEQGVRLLFERGKFTAADSRAVALLLALQLGFIAGASLSEIYSKVFYAMSDMRTPVLIGAAAFTLGVVLKFLWQDRYGAGGLVTATSVHFLLDALVLWIVLRGRIGRIGTRRVLRTGVHAAAAASLAILAAYQIGQHVSSGLIVWMPATAAAVYVAAILLSKEPFTYEVLAGRRVGSISRTPRQHEED